MSSKPVYYTDVVEQMRRFEDARKKVDERRKAENIQRNLPQGHGSGLNADLLDSYHYTDIISEVKSMIARLPKAGAVGGGGGGLSYRQVLSIAEWNL